MTRHPDLLTRPEAAAYLGRSVSTLKSGWGPRPLPGYKKPVMYSRRLIDQFVREQERLACSTNGAPAKESAGHGANTSTGTSSSTKGGQSEDQQISAIVKRQRRKRAARASSSSKRLGLRVVDGGSR